MRCCRRVSGLFLNPPCPKTPCTVGHPCMVSPLVVQERGHPGCLPVMGA